MMSKIGLCLVTAAILTLEVPADDSSARLPVLYCTDLFHPHDDPDDHFDLATLYSIPEVDLLGIVLDQGGNQKQRPGAIPVSQLNDLTGKKVPVAIGLERPLKSPLDTGIDQQEEFQAGIRLIIESLRESPQPVIIFAVGSMRDLVAAFHREPELFRTKVRRIGAYIGEASREEFVEYNVGLDPHAYVGLLRSGLPVYWLPCFDGGLWQNAGHASFWQARHEDLLRNSPPELIQFFIYALEKQTGDPLAFVRSPVDSQRKERLFADTRNLWCTATFAVLAERELRSHDGHFQTMPRNPDKEPAPAFSNELFSFEEVDVTVTDTGVVRYEKGPGSKKIRRFTLRGQTDYARGMTEATARLLEGFPVVGR
ncbi:MAG: nucleoside hydrolase [Pirellulaceae bacterium]